MTFVKVDCAQCKAPFEKLINQVRQTEARNGRHFCTQTCFGKFNQKRVELPCSFCGVVIVRRTKDVGRSKSGRVFCNQACSAAFNNKMFRSGMNNPNVRDTSYKVICFAYHEKKCVICSEDKVVAVHHHDGNHDNNDPMNLVPLCPTHHVYWHSKWRYLIEDRVKEYREQLYERLPLLEADNEDYDLCEEELLDVAEEHV